jgi:hypothetical protein
MYWSIDMEDKIKEIIRTRYFKCTLRKSDISVKRCIGFQEENFCSCELGRAIRREKEAVEERFDFGEKRKPRTPKNARLREINPKEISFIPSKRARFSDDIVVYDTLCGYFSYDPRVNTQKEKIRVALVPVRSYEKTKKYLMEVNAMEYREIPVDEILECHFQKRRSIDRDLDTWLKI